MTIKDASSRLARSRAQQAQTYSRVNTQPEHESPVYQPLPQAITLPTLKSVYDCRPVTYENGRLMAGDEVVRIRRDVFEITSNALRRIKR